MFYIHVPDMNDSVSSIAIDGISYKLRFTYNEKYDYWSFGILDDKNVNIIAMTRIVPNFPLFQFYNDSRLPDGIFGCVSDLDEVGRYAFRDKTAEFLFIPSSELE